MISVQDAKRLIQEHTEVLPSVHVPLLEALGATLAQSVFSGIDMPPFPQSAMDGYAFRFEENYREKPLQIVGEIQAGMDPGISLEAGTAVRIFTGAAVPEGADTVVMQEKVRVESGLLYLDDPDLKPGSNVRPRGSQTREGALVLPAGTTLTPAALGLLAGLGTADLEVWAKPRICLIITGNELAKPGAMLRPGEVYESNSVTLQAALKEQGMTQELIFRCNDVEQEIIQSLEIGLEKCDVVLCTGGISVGDYDLVKKAMEHCRVETVFYKVKQKPGKPLFFGKLGKKRVFGLPGNPGSVLTCYYEYVEPMLLKMRGNASQFPRIAHKILSETVVKKAGLTHFLKGKLDGEQVVPLQGQESYKMDGFALADALIVLDEHQETVEKGTMVAVHLVNPM
jgi:molybdopterin molybdotransferase